MTPAALFLLPANRLLGSEGWARELLRPHAGKGAELVLGPLRLRVLIDSEGQLQPLPDQISPAVSIQLPVEALGSLSGGPDALVSHAQVSGDAGLADALSRLIRHLRPDLGAALSPVLGRALAHRVDQGASQALHTLQESTARLAANWREYLAEGVAPLITRAELDGLRNETERLTQRISAIEARLAR